jgi:hypothetical protein
MDEKIYLIIFYIGDILSRLLLGTDVVSVDSVV